MDRRTFCKRLGCIVPAIAVSGCSLPMGKRTVRYYQKVTGREIPVTRGRADLSAISSGGIDSGAIIQIISSACSSTSTDGIFDANGIFSAFGSLGIGTRPTQADITLCKANLSANDGAVLQILWEVFKEVVTDGVHNLNTCPILALHPIEADHASGKDSDARFAERLYDFYKAKFKQDLSGGAKEAKARMVAAGLPVP